MNRKLVVPIVLAVMTLALAAGLPSRKAPSQPTEAAPRPAPARELTREEYAAVRDEFIRMMDDRDPRSVLAELRERVKTDDALLRSCHGLVHDLGHEAYEKYGDFGEAMGYQDELCNSGYLHGIIEAYFSGSADVFAAMRSVCGGYPPGKFLSWECYHGVGHGVMYYTSNDLPKALELCDGYESAFARQACANGVFMENFNADHELHPSDFLKEDDPFYPCQEQAARHKEDCYGYAPAYYLSLHKDAYADALKWCDDAERPYRETCVNGVGLQAMKLNANDPKFVESVCMSGGTDRTAPCVGGMAILSVMHHGSLEPTREMCESLEPSNREACRSGLESQAAFFD